MPIALTCPLELENAIAMTYLFNAYHTLNLSPETPRLQIDGSRVSILPVEVERLVEHLDMHFFTCL